MNIRYLSIVSSLSFFAINCLSDEVKKDTLPLLNSPTQISESEIKSISLNQSENAKYCNIRKVFLQATGLRSEAMLEVIVNGDIKGTIHAPGSDPNYVVTIESRSSSLELRGLKGLMKIDQIHAVLENCSSKGPNNNHEEGGLRWFRGEASKLAAETLRDLEFIEKYISRNDQITHTLPIKRLAAIAYASSIARGDLSHKVLEDLSNLNDSFKSESMFLDKLYEIGDLFDSVVDLRRVQEELEDVLSVRVKKN